MGEFGTIVRKFEYIRETNGEDVLAEDNSLKDCWDGVEFLPRFRTPEIYEVPTVDETVEHVENIDPDTYWPETETSPKIHASRIHLQGKIYWGTVTTYYPRDTVLPPSEPVQVPRKARDTAKPHYLAIKKVRPTSYHNIVPGWIKTQWNPTYFYPKKGTGILKKRKSPLEQGTPWLRGCETRNIQRVRQTTTGKRKRGLFADSDDEE